jgi:hypothetical protein
MGIKSRPVLLFAIVFLGLTLACAAPATTGGGSSATTPPDESDGSSSSTSCDFPSDDFVDVAGTYSVAGGKADQSGGNYTGTLTITNTGRNCFSAAWTYDDGRTRTGTLQMIGNIMDGDWQEGDQKGTFGATVAEGQPISSWWGYEGGDETEYGEVMTPQ